MLFPTHLVAGYVMARGTNRPVWWVIFGTVLPDAIDKPLALAGVTELFHTVAHSALAVVVLALALKTGARGAAVWVGWVIHLAMDAGQIIINGRPADVQFLLWPVVEHTPVISLPPVEFFLGYIGSPAFFIEIGFWVFAAFVASRDPSLRAVDPTRDGDAKSALRDD
jgi:hypothetical protein